MIKLNPSVTAFKSKRFKEFFSRTVCPKRPKIYSSTVRVRFYLKQCKLQLERGTRSCFAKNGFGDQVGTSTPGYSWFFVSIVRETFFFFIEVSCQTGGSTYYVDYITSISGSGFTAVGPGAQANDFHQSPARGTLYFHCMSQYLLVQASSVISKVDQF